MTSNPELRAELLALAAEDGRVRTELIHAGELFDGYHPRMRAVHEHNTAVLVRIINVHGWPGRALVGDDGAKAAWLVLQHSIGAPALMRRCLPLLQKAAVSGDIDPAEPAYLADRIAVFEGRPQRYGTSFDWNEAGEFGPHELEDPDRVDEWRASVGLGPLAERIVAAREQLKIECESPPADLAARKREMDAWAIAVGWRPRKE